MGATATIVLMRTSPLLLGALVLVTQLRAQMGHVVAVRAELQGRRLDETTQHLQQETLVLGQLRGRRL